jgi:hypothetical protein
MAGECGVVSRHRPPPRSPEKTSQRDKMLEKMNAAMLWSRFLRRVIISSTRNNKNRFARTPKRRLGERMEAPRRSSQSVWSCCFPVPRAAAACRAPASGVYANDLELFSNLAIRYDMNIMGGSHFTIEDGSCYNMKSDICGEERVQLSGLSAGCWERVGVRRSVTLEIA